MPPNAFVQKNVLQVTREDVDYFKQFKPLHYITLREMIRHGEAEIMDASPGA